MPEGPTTPRPAIALAPHTGACFRLFQALIQGLPDANLRRAVLVARRPLRHVHPLGAVRAPGPPRVDDVPGEHSAQGIPWAGGSIRSPALQPRGVGGAGPGRGHALHDPDLAPPRRLLPLGLQGPPTSRPPRRRPAATCWPSSSTPARNAGCATASITRCWTGATPPTSAARPATRKAGPSLWPTCTRRCWNCAPTTATCRCCGTTAAGPTRRRTGIRPR